MELHSDKFRIGGIMVRVFPQSALRSEFSPGRVKPKTMQLVFTDSPLSTQY